MGSTPPMRRTLVGCAVLLCACGYTSPGGGTGTLYVTARLTSDGSTSGSRARVTVRQGSSDGALIDDASVTIRGGALGPTPVPLAKNEHQYQLDGFTWVEGFRLEVTRGDDRLDGSIDAPGATLITNPVEDQVVKASEPFTVQWRDTRNAPAHDVHLRLQKADVDRTLEPGALDFHLDANALAPTGDETVRVERGNTVELAGGATGSELSAATSHQIHFKVE